MGWGVGGGGIKKRCKRGSGIRGPDLWRKEVGEGGGRA